MKTEIKVGKYTLESLTTGMYNDPKITYREYIQNSVDSLEEAVRLGIISKNEMRIDIVVDSEEDIISIKDNGVGIPKEVQDKVFKRFYKGDSSVNPNSIGIGLSLAKSIIEKQGGEIKLTSEEGKGTTFIISFLEM